MLFLGNVARVMAVFVRGQQDLWSPWIGTSASYPCATPLPSSLTLTLTLALALALALALTLCPFIACSPNCFGGGNEGR